MDRKCQYCKKVLTNTTYFCNQECENKFREENQELYIRFKDGSYDWFCPVNEFMETDEYIMVNNYILEKSKIEKWKIDKCSCNQEFTEIELYNL